MMSCGSRVQKRLWLFLLLIISLEIIMMWVSLAQARPLSQATKGEDEQGEGEEERLMVRLGSRPPSCEHKCWGCETCMAIQVPTSTDHLRPQYANYEPEGWKCKCGSAFYNP